MINNHIPIDSNIDPTLKPDVLGGMKPGQTINTIHKAGLDAVNRRLEWFLGIKDLIKNHFKALIFLSQIQHSESF